MPSDEELEAAGICKKHGQYLPCAACSWYEGIEHANADKITKGVDMDSLLCPHHRNKFVPCEFCKMEREEKERQAKEKEQAKAEYDYTVKPEHYNADPSGVECIEAIENAPGNLFTAAKYLWRGGKKPGEVTERDIEKARWYLFREFYRQGWITLEQWEHIVGRKQ